MDSLKGQILSTKSMVMLMNVLDYFRRTARDIGETILVERTADACGVTASAVYRTRLRVKSAEAAGTVLTSPCKTRNRPKRKSEDVADSVKAAVLRKIDDKRTQSQRVTLKSLAEELREDGVFDFSVTGLNRLLHSIKATKYKSKHNGTVFISLLSQTQTKSNLQSTSRSGITSADQCETTLQFAGRYHNMPATKEEENSGAIDVESVDDEDKKEETTQNSTTLPISNTECETDNDDKPLQIDTGSEVKSEVEHSGKEDTPTNGTKRSSDSSETNPTPTKKARPKPKPMKIENMKEYVDNNTIEKLTTTTLFHWLKERNLHCSTRDKKADLIQKIKNQFITSTS